MLLPYLVITLDVVIIPCYLNKLFNPEFVIVTGICKTFIVVPGGDCPLVNY